jgi:hypothetical protein
MVCGNHVPAVFVNLKSSLKEILMDTITPTYTAMFPGMVVKLCKDMKFVGIFTVIYGAITCIGIITAAIGIPIIISGIRLQESADYLLSYAGNSSASMLESALERQSRYFFIIKVLIIVSLVLILLYLIFIVLIIGIVGITSTQHY